MKKVEEKNMKKSIGIYREISKQIFKKELKNSRKNKYKDREWRQDKEKIHEIVSYVFRYFCIGIIYYEIHNKNKLFTKKNIYPFILNYFYDFFKILNKKKGKNMIINKFIDYQQILFDNQYYRKYEEKDKLNVCRFTDQEILEEQDIIYLSLFFELEVKLNITKNMYSDDMIYTHKK